MKNQLPENIWIGLKINNDSFITGDCHVFLTEDLAQIYKKNVEDNDKEYHVEIEERFLATKTLM